MELSEVLGISKLVHIHALQNEKFIENNSLGEAWDLSSFCCGHDAPICLRQKITVLRIPMSIQLYAPGQYDSPLTPDGRARTIAAFHVAQGDVDVLSKETEMRRDILKRLMSPLAVSCWIDQGWLEKVPIVEVIPDAGKVQLLRLTSKGIVTCRNSVGGGGNVPTTRALVDRWRTKMKVGGESAFEVFEFPSLTST
jgi:hypothetical protein